MDPSTTFGPIAGENVITGTHVSGGTPKLDHQQVGRQVASPTLDLQI